MLFFVVAINKERKHKTDLAMTCHLKNQKKKKTSQGNLQSSLTSLLQGRGVDRTKL